MEMTGLRVMHVLPHLGTGGAEGLCLSICQRLAQKGHTVCLVLMHGTRPAASDLGIDYTWVTTSRVTYSITGKDIINTEDLDLVIDRFNPQIIHSHLIEAELLVRGRINRGICYVSHWHGRLNLTEHLLPSHLLKRSTWWTFYNILRMRRQYRISGTRFICVSGYMQHYVKRWFGAPQDSITVIPNAIDLSRFENLTPEAHIGLRLISVGSLQWHKNHIFQFRLLRRLLDEGHSDIHLSVVGDGPLRQYLQSESDKLGLKPYVHFVGSVKEPAFELAKADVLLHTPLEEAFGLVLAEAMAAGLPCVATCTGGIPEVVSHGVDGFLIDEGDIDGFASCIRLLHSDAQMRVAMSNKARFNAQRFGIDSYIDRIEQFYRTSIKIT